MSNFNPSRLALARNRRGFSKTELSERTGLSTRSLTAFERDEKRPGDQTLRLISESLDFPISFFIGPDLEVPPEGASSFRALSTLTARQVGQALGSGALALSLSKWIDERFTLPLPTVPRLLGLDPEIAAEVVRKEWGLGDRPIRNVIHTLEAHGIKVFSLVEECSAVDAYSFWLEGKPFVFLNTMKSAEHSRMDAVHELGHLVMHWRHETPRGRDIEQEANSFASAFLMPRADVLAHVPLHNNLTNLIRAKRRWKVSLAALTYRLHKLGLLSEWHYRTLFIELSEKGYRRNEPETVARETSQVLAKVFGALRQEGVTKVQVAEELSIPITELNKLIFGLVLTPMAGIGSESTESDSYPRDFRLV